MYESLAQMRRLSNEDFKSLFNDVESTNSSTLWECPRELKLDERSLSLTVQHILRISHGVNLKKLRSEAERKHHLCSMLDIPCDSNLAAIKKARKNIGLRLHPDKTLADPISPFAEKAFKEIEQVWNVYTKKNNL